MQKFISYKMTHDTGFAPNPFGEHLTLATCKPTIRRTKKPGDWVAGFASKKLVETSRRAGVAIPASGLVYLMRVAETIKLDDYFYDPRFQQKKPTKGCADPILRCGDNIYASDGFGGHRQLPNDSHDASSGTVNHDTSGVNILLADVFYYFGRNCLIPDGGWESIGISLSTGRTFYCDEADLKNIQLFLHKGGYQPGVHGLPCLWDDVERTSPVLAGCAPKQSSKGLTGERAFSTCGY
jgi:hypothetical protein